MIKACVDTNKTNVMFTKHELNLADKSMKISKLYFNSITNYVLINFLCLFLPEREDVSSNDERALFIESSMYGLRDAPKLYDPTDQQKILDERFDSFTNATHYYGHCYLAPPRDFKANLQKYAYSPFNCIPGKRHYNQLCTVRKISLSISTLLKLTVETSLFKEVRHSVFLKYYIFQYTV